MSPHNGNYEDCWEVTPRSLVKCADNSDSPAAFDIRADIYNESLMHTGDRRSRILQNKMSVHCINVHEVTSPNKIKSYEAPGKKITNEMWN
jgi:hypothetical protein